ncbi:MAG: TetR/AcrR family transcriptional regulator [Spirochaetes bacterium]|nr:TetR/AcrR family transcriptional regulator [Spirochaetota bacterium]
MGVIERRKREKEMRMELAVEAAMEIFNEEGYHSITMEKIAERSEISRAALYLYFKNKDEILITAIAEHTDYFAGLLESLYERRETVKEKLIFEIWNCFKKFYEKNPVAFNATQYFHQSEMIRNLPDALRNVLYKSGSRVVGLQHKIVGYGIDEGIFIRCNPRTLSEVIWSTFLGIIDLERSKYVLSKKSHLDITRDTAIKVLSRGILAHSDVKC